LCFAVFGGVPMCHGIDVFCNKLLLLDQHFVAEHIMGWDVMLLQQTCVLSCSISGLLDVLESG